MSAEPMNCVTAGWVAQPLEVPVGHHLGFDLWKAGGLAVPKPDNRYFSKKMPQEVELRLTPPIALVRQFDGDVDAIIAFLTELREERIAQLARERFGPVRGVEAMRSVHPWDEPDTDKEVIAGRVPTFAVGQTGEEGDGVRLQCKLETRAHRGAHSWRIAKWKNGDRTSPFPAGTLRGHTFLGMPLDLPAPDAILGAPHPSREEVEAELAEKRAQRARLEEQRRERMRVREERRERAREIAEDEALEQELEDEARRVHVILDADPLTKASATETLEPTRVIRRALGEKRPSRQDGARVIVLRTRDEDPRKTKRRSRRGANDPPD